MYYIEVQVPCPVLRSKYMKPDAIHRAGQNTTLKDQEMTYATENNMRVYTTFSDVRHSIGETEVECSPND